MFIQFFHELDLEQILEGGPWTVGSHHLLLRRHNVGGNPLHVPLQFLSFWIQIHKLPVGSFLKPLVNNLETLSAGFWNMIARIRDHHGNALCEFLWRLMLT